MTSITTPNHQYHIPNSLPSQPDGDSPVKSPERRPGLEHFKVIKSLEDYIVSCRETALALDHQAEAAQTLAVIGLLGKWLSPKKLKTPNDLIEAESLKGGELFGPGHRFWFSGPSETQPQVADWYHASPNPAKQAGLINATAAPEVVLHFQTTPTSLHKLYNGVEYPVTLDDLQNFLAAINGYVQKIGDLYPVDATIAELVQEMVQEFMAQQGSTDPNDYTVAA